MRCARLPPSQRSMMSASRSLSPRQAPSSLTTCGECLGAPGGDVLRVGWGGGGVDVCGWGDWGRTGREKAQQPACAGCTRVEVVGVHSRDHLKQADSATSFMKAS